MSRTLSLVTKTEAIKWRQTYFLLWVLLNGAEKTHVIFNRLQREQGGGSEVPGSPSHRIYSGTISLHGVRCSRREEAVRPFVACIPRMPFSFGLMWVGSAGAEDLPFLLHGFQIGYWKPNSKRV